MIIERKGESYADSNKINLLLKDLMSLFNWIEKELKKKRKSDSEKFQKLVKCMVAIGDRPTPCKLDK